jgi:hypothetical protein
MGKFIDLKGQTFGRLHVVKRVYPRWNPDRKVYWECLCSCGSIHVVQGHSLRGGGTRSCGCLQREVAKERGREFGFRNLGRRKDE